jgi:hypothetical protein
MLADEHPDPLRISDFIPIDVMTQRARSEDHAQANTAVVLHNHRLRASIVFVISLGSTFN